jgi:hypothetical protein
MEKDGEKGVGFMRVSISMIRFFCIYFFISIFVGLTAVPALYAGSSTVTEADGYACMGDTKSRKQTETEALANAKQKAVEHASTYIKSETRVKDFELEKEVLDAYANATVKIIQELEKAWYKDPSLGECYKMKIKAEVIPDEKGMAQAASTKMDDPNAPLQVQLWTDKKAYKQSDKIKIFLKGNKPFYARVIYEDASGNLLQLLPNPYRTDHYFNGGMVYEIPSGNDQFELEVSPPFGQERIILYAGSSPLGEINLKNQGGVYEVKTKSGDVGIKTRGVKLQEKGSAASSSASEFYESKAVLKTAK